MNLLDLIIVALAVSAAAGGYAAGLLSRVSSWIGLAVGLYVGVRVTPTVVTAFAGGADPTLRLVIAAGAFLLIAGGGASIGDLIGRRLRRSIPFGFPRRADRIAGAGLGIAGLLLLVWLLVPVASKFPGAIASAVRASTIVHVVEDVAPRPPDALNTLARVVSGTGFPQVFADLRPAPETGTPPAAAAIPPAVQQRVKGSTVQVRGPACRQTKVGSGFTAAPETVVTNAHVVAGMRRAHVLRPDGRRLPAEVVFFDPRRDLAVLAVKNLGQEPLPLDEPQVGSTGAVFGYPGGQRSVEVSPARIERRAEAIGRTIYDSGRVRRDVLFLAARLEAGDSGGALVNADGAVVGVAFATAPDRQATAYALTTEEVRRALSMRRAGSVDTGPCTA